MIDLSGHDAVWLNSTKSASGFGHSAVLIKNSHNKWDYLTYTGQSGLTKKTLGYYYSFANSSTLLKTINQKYRKGENMGPYDCMLYFKGRFKSRKNIVSYFCLHMTVDFLSKGVFEKYDHEYHVALDYARRMNIPNNAFAGMKYFDDTSVFHI